MCYQCQEPSPAAPPSTTDMEVPACSPAQVAPAAGCLCLLGV
jgi:hypothetical protein